MKQKYSFEECYQILKIKPDCSWSDLRKSYKSQIQKWHPDRFDDKSDKKTAANEKIKSLNIAYNHVSKYFKENGSLPPIIETTHPKPRKEPQKTYKSTKSNITKKTDNFNNAIKKRSVTSAKSAIVILAVVIILILLNKSKLPQSPPLPSDTPNNADATSRIDFQSKSTHEPKTASSLENQSESSDFLAPITKNLINIETENTVEEDDEEEENEFFTYGSTYGNVVYIQGTPDKVEEDTWFYGNSKVIFSEGKVIRWERRPGSPLKANIAIDSE